jgi:hypothetical protein
MAIAPEVGSSSPAIIRSAVVFPQPEGPYEDHELAVGDGAGERLDRRRPFGKTFVTSWNETSATVRTSRASGL